MIWRSTSRDGSSVRNVEPDGDGFQGEVYVPHYWAHPTGWCKVRWDAEGKFVTDFPPLDLVEDEKPNARS